MSKMIKLLGEAIEKTCGKVRTQISEYSIPNDEGANYIALPVGNFLWTTRVNVHDDATVNAITVKRLYVHFFEDWWKPIKATASIYLGEVEPVGYATIFWPHYTGEITGLDLREEMPFYWRMWIDTNEKQQIQVKVQHTLISAPFYAPSH